MKFFTLSLATTLALSVFSNAYSQTVTPHSKSDIKEAVKEAVEEKDKKTDDDQYQSLVEKYFGAGLIANIDFGDQNHRRVKNARVVGGVVRIEEESKAQLGFMLEAHKFTSTDPNKKRVGGPFVGLVMGGEGGIETGILGYMWGFRQPNTTQSLNIGLGLSISPKVQMLGDGIINGEPLPKGETEVRYKSTTKYGLAISVSFGF